MWVSMDKTMNKYHLSKHIYDGFCYLECQAKKNRANHICLSIEDTSFLQLINKFSLISLICLLRTHMAYAQESRKIIILHVLKITIAHKPTSSGLIPIRFIYSKSSIWKTVKFSSPVASSEVAKHGLEHVKYIYLHIMQGFP